HDQGNGSSRAPALLECPGAELEEGPPVAEAGQLIGARQDLGAAYGSLQVLFQALAVGNVGGDRQAHQTAVYPANGLVPALIPAAGDRILQFPDQGPGRLALRIDQLRVGAESARALLP